jgi:glycosyltransferase involved in cell wall biosynthesis
MNFDYNHRISIIIPLFNESATLHNLFATLTSILNQIPAKYEIIAVNDGSTDNTLHRLIEMQNHIPSLKILDLTRNFGKESAVYAGFSYATGDCALTIDGDLQDPPELILKMFNTWKEGYEIVRGVRSSRETDSLLKRKTASIFYFLMNRISDTKFTSHAGDYILLDRIAINAFLELKEKVRFNKGLFSWLGFKEKLIYHTRGVRISGRSKWNYYKLFKFSIDGITSFSKTPLEIWTYIGFFCSCSAFAYGLFFFLRTLILGSNVKGYPSLLIIMLFFNGLNMIGIGILGSYIGRIFIETKQRPIFLARKLYIANQPSCQSTNIFTRSEIDTKTEKPREVC